MRTLEEIKNEYAQSCLYNDWDEMYSKGDVSDTHLEEITEIYANERVNEELSKFCDFAIAVEYLEEEDKTPLINMFNYRNNKLTGKAPEDFNDEFLNRLYD